MNLGNPSGENRRALWSWAFYDFANSSFTTVIVTFIFPIYLANVYFSGGSNGLDTPLDAALNETGGQAMWGWIVAVSALSVGLSAPFLGAIADMSGPRKPWIFVLSLMSILGSAVLFIKPDPTLFPWLLAIAFVIANYGFEMGGVFNNAMLPGLTRQDRMGRWSGWAWGLGYGGGLICLLICLPLALSMGEMGARVSNLVVAAWFTIFMIPLFINTPDAPRGISIGEAVRRGWAETIATGREVFGQRNLATFMISRMIFNDGLVTIFSMGALFAALRYGMDTTQIIAFGILLNITAVIGSVVLARQDDMRGKKWVLNLSLVLLIFTFLFGMSLPYLLGSREAALVPFIVLGGALGLFVGPIQAASRSFIAVVSPPEKSTRYFGFFALTGKATAFIGPALVGTVTLAAAGILRGSETDPTIARGMALDAGMMVIPVMLLIGLIAFQWVKEPKFSS